MSAPKGATYRLPAARLAVASGVLIGVLIAVSLLSLAVGTTTAVPIGEAARALLRFLTGRGPAGPDDLSYELVVNYRLPRVLIGALVGLCLSSAGTALQGLMLNPL